MKFNFFLIFLLFANYNKLVGMEIVVNSFDEALNALGINNYFFTSKFFIQSYSWNFYSL
jgi:hypothetical protein